MDHRNFVDPSRRPSDIEVAGAYLGLIRQEKSCGLCHWMRAGRQALAAEEIAKMALPPSKAIISRPEEEFVIVCASWSSPPV